MDIYLMPLWHRKWLIDRLYKQFEMEKENFEKSKSKQRIK